MKFLMIGWGLLMLGLLGGAIYVIVHFLQKIW